MAARDVTSSDPPLVLHEYALESHRKALDLYDLVFPPWRWRKWWREYREIKRRVRVLRKALGK